MAEPNTSDDLLGDLLSQAQPTNEIDNAAAELFDGGVSNDVDDPQPERKPEPQSKPDTDRLHQSERERLLALHESQKLRAERAAAESKQALDAIDSAVAAAQDALTKAKRAALDAGSGEEADAVAAETAAQKALFDAMLRRQSAEQHHQAAQQAAQSATAEPNLDLLAWRERNPKYGSDAAFTAEADRIAIELEHTEGLDTRRPQFWKKLDERLNRGKRMQPNGRTGPNPARTPPSQPAEPRADKASRNEATLMEAIGLDPSDADHLAELRKQHARVIGKRAA